jgi:predicted metal-dependent peptidase
LIREAVLEVGIELVPVYIRGPANAPPGNAPGTGLYELEHSSTGKLPWQQLLRRCIGQARQVRPVFNHPPRRFPDLIGIIPGKRRQPDRPKIMAVIDSSESMTDELLELIDAELAKLARDYVLTIVECDFEIQRVYEYRRRLKTIAGRGGTDFHPPLEKKFLKKHHPDLIVIFSDGQGPAPTKPPPVPLIWCLTPEDEAPVEWGKKIRMQAP